MLSDEVRYFFAENISFHDEKFQGVNGLNSLAIGILLWVIFTQNAVMIFAQSLRQNLIM